MTRSTAGFTLIELLIVIAIIGVMLGVAYDSVVEPMRTHAIETRRHFAQSEMVKVHRMLDRDIRAASQVILGMGEISSGSRSLILDVPTASLADSTIESIRAHYHFTITEGTDGFPGGILLRDLYRQTSSGWEKIGSYVLSRDLSDLHFSGESDDWAQVRLVSVALLSEARVANTRLRSEETKALALRGVAR